MAIKLDSGFEILRFSDLNYEKMTVELQYCGEQIAQINMDNGFENLEIEIFTEFVRPDFNPKFGLDAFVEAINESKKILRDCIPKDS